MDELQREVRAEKEYILETLWALKEALGRKEKTALKRYLPLLEGRRESE